jgi:hypothetical protein
MKSLGMALLEKFMLIDEGLLKMFADGSRNYLKILAPPS